ncbi:uncharacterized protein N7446_005026 [Penicillium canescens]|uniref:Fibronectin type-III domain-containing protein n=1 Tax=Penicillium canescens TaxID=5083 RepID=A0AAD6I949_PENCN|nr:uncharacterized protein N7446_005026 [Penicillium canescens]KAJ6038212.1 hypothetical protein N7460_007983 [Penicillium canescens]KAJ6039690.1 hypothetical protein N7444_008595 [Penicillium canescens]KAJ6067989.1 hypothetical protein N7446_005026 [Penicillium canescens]
MPRMFFPPSLILFSVLAQLHSANGSGDYFVVGDLGQYTTNGVPTPTLSGSVIEVSALGSPTEDGILLYLSPDMQSSLKSTMDSSCDTQIDSRCYTAVMNFLEDANNVIESHNANKRELQERNGGLLGAGAMLIAGLLFPLIYEGDHVVPVPIKIPAEQLEESFELETATAIIIVTDDSTQSMTVTAPPEQNKATGSPATITTFASAGNGGSKGDVNIKLDAAVAAHLQKLLSSSDNSNCDVGDDFFKKLQSRALDLSNVICGAQNILADGIDRGGFPDWLLMKPTGLPWTSAEVVAAVNTVAQWALTQATFLNPTITQTQLNGLAVGAFALSWVYFNNGAIKPDNIIPSASLQGDPSITSCTQQTATECGLQRKNTYSTTATYTQTAEDSVPTDSSDGNGQQVAVASYINPLGDPSAWEHLIDDYPSDKMPILIANVVNGPDSTVNDDWTNVIKRASASGKTVLGYVRTGYLGVSDQKFLTRLGSGDLADWTAQIEQDIDMWYTLYGSDIGGIFFDEGWPECGDNDKYVDLYKYINDYTKRTHPGAYTILNPGSPMASCFEDSMDTLLTFELSYDAYVNSYTPNDWIPKDPRKLWHIIYNVPDSAIDEVITLSKKRGAGFIQLTDDLLPNPYDNLPADSYIKKILDAVDGGALLNEDASSWQSGISAGAVSGLTVVTSEYTSAQLSWYPASGALGYHVYSGNTVVASVPNTMTQITLGSLTPGASHDFHVSAVGGGGDLGSSSSTVTVVTDSLPNGKTVTNWHSTPQEGSTIIKADILVPYAFVRLYLWDSVGCDFDTDPGWSVNFEVDKYVCTHYMVEGTTIYKYSGTLPKGSTAPPWAWTSMSTITLDITDYTYTWTLPLGTLTTDTSKFVIQTQGYNVQGNFVEPDASDYDCEGSTMCSTPDMLKWCDHAVNYLHRDDDPFYNTNGAASQTRNCWGDQTRGCGVFVQGTNCSISGNDMWNDYQNIRKIGGCNKCGTYHRGNGCLVTIDYVYQCNNHD